MTRDDFWTKKKSVALFDKFQKQPIFYTMKKVFSFALSVTSLISLSLHEVEPLYDACDQHLRDLAGALEPDWLIGVGAFAESRARIALADFNIQIGRILHPSPASPAANRGWASQAVQQLQTLGIWS